MWNVHEGKSVHGGLIIHEGKIVHERKKFYLDKNVHKEKIAQKSKNSHKEKNCSWRQKFQFFFKIFPKKSQRATAECQPTPKMFILGNKPTPVYPDTNLTPPFLHKIVIPISKSGNTFACLQNFLK